MRISPILATIALLAGCSTASPQASPTSTPTATHSAAARHHKKAPDPAKKALAELRGVDWKGADWQSHITGAHTEFGAIWVDTDLYPKASNRSLASGICSAVSGWELEHGGKFTGVRVAAADGQRLSMRTSLGGHC